MSHVVIGGKSKISSEERDLLGYFILYLCCYYQRWDKDMAKFVYEDAFVTLRISYDEIKTVKGNISLIWNPSRNWRNYGKNQYIITLKFWLKKKDLPKFSPSKVSWILGGYFLSRLSGCNVTFKFIVEEEEEQDIHPKSGSKSLAPVIWQKIAYWGSPARVIPLEAGNTPLHYIRYSTSWGFRGIFRVGVADGAIVQTNMALSVTKPMISL